MSRIQRVSPFYHVAHASSATALLSSFFLDLLVGCSSTWRCAYEHFPQFCKHSWTCITSILEGATFHRMSYCKFLWGNPCRAIETFYHWDLFLWDFGFSTHFSHSVAWKNLETDSAVSFFHAYRYRDGNCNCLLFTHCPLVSHCQQSPRILCTRCFVPWFLKTAFLS